MSLFKLGKTSRYIMILLGFFITLYAAIWLFSPQIIRYYLTEPLAQLGLKQSANSRVRFNPFLSKLALSQFALVQEDKSVVLIEQLVIDVDLLGLLNDEIKIDVINIANANLEVVKTADSFFVAGINISEPSETTSTTGPQSKPFTYRITIAELSMTNSQVVASYLNEEQQLDIDELTVRNGEFSVEQQHAELTFKGKFNNAPLMITAQANMQGKQGEIVSELNLSQFPLASLAVFIPDDSKLIGDFTFSGAQEVTLANEVIDIALAKVVLNTKQLQMSQQQQTLQLANTELSVPAMKVSLANGVISELSGQGQLALEALSINNAAQQLIAFDKLTINDISPTWIVSPLGTEESGNFQIDIATIITENLSLSKISNAMPALATIDAITLDTLVISPKNFSVDTITVDNIMSDIVLDDNKALKHLVSLADDSQEQALPSPDSSAEKASDTETEPFTFFVNKLDISQDNQINFTDESVDPVYKRTIFIDELVVDDIGNGALHKQEKTTFSLVGRSNTYAKFNFTGFMQPFADIESYYIKGGMKEVSLVAVSSYMKDALQMELKSGQLNMEIDATLIKDQISGDIDLNISGLETSVANSHETDEVKDNAAVPLNVALGMLMDSHGDVSLSVPLSGSTSDPEFGLTSFFALVTQKAVMAATQSYLMQTFIPYANVVSVAMTAGEMLLKIRFEDLAYQAKQVEPNAEQDAYILAFIELMKDNENAKVKVCAVTTPEDIGLPLGTKITEKAQINALHALGEERGKAFKSHVSEDQNIASARLILCAPQIDTTKDAVSRIELSL